MQTNPASSGPIPLEYRAEPSRRRRLIRRVLLGLILLAMAFCGWRWGPFAWHQTKTLYYQRQCMRFTLPADTVVYEEDPAPASLLLQEPGYSPYALNRQKSTKYHPSPVPAAAFYPACFRSLSSLATSPISVFSIMGKTSGAIMFLHERVSPAGHHRLVAVSYAPETDSFQPAFIEGYDCEACAASPATSFTPLVIAPKMYPLDVMSGYPRHPPLVRVYAGQPDPNDPAHFTIRYQMWGQEDVLDGRLLDNDDVSLTPRHLPDWQRN